jgi:hypothetical protein
MLVEMSVGIAVKPILKPLFGLLTLLFCVS